MDAKRLAEIEEQFDTVPQAQYAVECKLRKAEKALAAARAEVAQLRLHLAHIATGKVADPARFANATLAEGSK